MNAYLVVLMIFLFTLVSIFTISGNLLVMLAFFKERKLRRWNNYFLINLAIADTLVGAISMPFYCLYLIKGEWPLYVILCDLWLTLDYTMCTSSCLSILVISIDRYWSLAYPVTYRQKMSTCMVMCLILPTWVIPAVLYILGILVVHQLVERNENDKQCYILFRDNPMFVILSTVVNYWAIIVIILVLYYKIYKITNFFWRRKRERGVANGSICKPRNAVEHIQMKRIDARDVTEKAKTNGSDDTSSDSEDSQNQQHGYNLSAGKRGSAMAAIQVTGNFLQAPANVSAERDASTMNQTGSTATCASSVLDAITPLEENNPEESVAPKLKSPQTVKNSKAMRVLTAVLFCFIVCWTPYSVMAVVRSFNSDLVPSGLYVFAYGLCYVNSFFNPFLYAYANEVFRRTFWRIISCS